MMLKRSFTKLLGRPSRKQESTKVVAESEQSSSSNNNSSSSSETDAKPAAAATPASLTAAEQKESTKVEEDRSTSVSSEESDNDDDHLKSVKSYHVPQQPPPARGCLKQLSHWESLRQRYGAEANDNDRPQRSQSASAVDLTDTISSNNRQVARSSSFVRFSTVQIHQHPVILGDNPACSRGPPLSIDWEALDSTEFSIDDLEKSRARRGGRRHAEELVLPKHSRVRTLRQCGYSRKDFRQAKAEIKDIQRTRADVAEEFLNRLRRLGMGALHSPEDCESVAQVAAMNEDMSNEDW